MKLGKVNKILYVLLLSLLSIFLFSCKKAKYVPGSGDIERVSFKDISVKYLIDSSFRIKNATPLENNGELSFNADDGFNNIFKIDYDKEKLSFKIIFKKDIEINKLEGIITIKNKNEVEVGSFKLRIYKNTDRLKEQITLLNDNLLRVRKTSDHKDKPEDLRVGVSFIRESDFIKLNNALKEAQEVFNNKKESQNKINDQFKLLKSYNDTFQTNLIIGKKNPEYPAKGSIIAVASFVTIVGSALVCLVILFMYKNKIGSKGKNENKK